MNKPVNEWGADFRGEHKVVWRCYVPEDADSTFKPRKSHGVRLFTAKVYLLDRWEFTASSSSWTACEGHPGLGCSRLGESYPAK